jgi:hypothetical protein
MWPDIRQHFAYQRSEATLVPFSVGAIVQKGHGIPGMNIQDAVAVCVSQRCIMAFVSDGCGSPSPSSINDASLNEIGANVSCVLAIETCRELMLLGESLENATSYARLFSTRFLRRISRLASLLAGGSRRGRTGREHVLREYLMGTLLGVVLSENAYIILAAGDGVIGLNGQITTRESHAGAYPANALLLRPFSAASLDLADSVQCVHAGRLACLQNVLLGTDGCYDLVTDNHLATMLRSTSPRAVAGHDRRFFLEFRRCIPCLRTDSPNHDDRAVAILRRIPCAGSDIVPKGEPTSADTIA